MLACLILASHFGVAAAATETVPATSPLVRYEGRVAIDIDSQTVRMAYPGVTTHLSAHARQVAMRCDASTDTLFLDVSTNGGPFERRRLEKGEQEVVLYEGPAEPCDLVVVKRTESWQGLLEVKAFTTDGGDLRAAQPLPERRLLFIGDSITCGSGTDIRPEDPNEGPFTSSGRHTYAWQLSRQLDTQCNLVSYGGRGALRDWEGKTWPESVNALQFYELSLPDVPGSRWDHSKYNPDIVAIALGANDLNQGLPDGDAYVAAYSRLVSRVRDNHPDAWVLLLDCPMFGDGEKREYLGDCLDTVVERFNGDRIRHVNVGYQPGRPEDSHPTASQHLEIARELAPIFHDCLE
ncbi:MAG: GDSL-type esterase/lipase family protein [Planctomycetota bacterium]